MKPLSPLGSLLFGVKLPFEALRLILSHRTLLLWSLAPVLITAALYSFLILRLQTYVGESLARFFESFAWSQTHWGGWILWSATLFGGLLIFVGAALTFSLSASLVAAPLNDFLAEKAEPLATPPLPPVPTPTLSARSRQIGIDMLKTLATLAAYPIVLVGSWFPVVNLLTFALAFLVLAFQFISYPQTRRNQGLGEGIAFLFRHFWACLGFGAMTFLLFSIPGVSIFALPVAVVSGTLLFARKP